MSTFSFSKHNRYVCGDEIDRLFCSQKWAMFLARTKVSLERYLVLKEKDIIKNSQKYFIECRDNRKWFFSFFVRFSVLSEQY